MIVWLLCIFTSSLYAGIAKDSFHDHADASRNQQVAKLISARHSTADPTPRNEFLFCKARESQSDEVMSGVHLQH